MYSPLAIANAIIDLNHEGMPPRSSMALNKLVYFIHGWSLAYDREIVSELPQVWRYGPVYESLYHALNEFGHSEIYAPVSVQTGARPPAVPQEDTRTWEIIRSVVNSYADIDAMGLSSIAHAPGSPWKIEAEHHDFLVPKGTVVPKSLINDHFRNILAEHRAAKVPA